MNDLVNDINLNYYIIMSAIMFMGFWGFGDVELLNFHREHSYDLTIVAAYHHHQIPYLDFVSDFL